MLLKRPSLLRREPDPLPSLFDRHPDALAASRHPRGVRDVALDAIVGTARHPTQNTVDFLPLPALRGRNWEARWQRITQAMQRLAVLPPVELLQVGHEYWVVDGHNRVAAARKIGAAAIDADVTELLVPGVESDGHPDSLGVTVVSDELRQAGEGRLTQRAGIRPDEPTRDVLALGPDADAAPEAQREAPRGTRGEMGGEER